MKRKIIAIISLLTVLGIGGCSAEDTTQQTTVETEVVKIDIDMSSVDWENAEFVESLNTICSYTEMDLKAFSMMCAKGYAKNNNCELDMAYSSALECATNLQLMGAELNEYLIVGSETWNPGEEEKVAGLATDFVNLFKEMSVYIEIADSSIENELNAVFEMEEAKAAEEQALLEAEEAQKREAVNLDDENVIASITSFASYDSKMLLKVSATYAKGYAIENDMSEQDANKEVKKIVIAAKNNSTLLVDMLKTKNTWTEAMTESAQIIASDFVAFVNDFKYYNSLASEAETTEKTEENPEVTTTNEDGETPSEETTIDVEAETPETSVSGTSSETAESTTIPTE